MPKLTGEVPPLGFLRTMIIALRAPLRDKALFALMYLTSRRISELLPLKKSDLRYEKIGGVEVITVRARALKRKDKPTAETPIPLGDPLVKYVLEYLKHLKADERLFPIGRVRAWQIVKDHFPKLWCHWFRHARLTHLSSEMDVYELADFAKWKKLDMAMEYVHPPKRRILEKMKRVDEEG